MIEINCKEIVSNIKEDIKKNIEEKVTQGYCRPALAIIQIGDVEASNRYVRNKLKDAEEVGIKAVLHKLIEEVTQEELEELLDELSGNASVDGIMVQLPVPKHISVDSFKKHIAKEKDVDGFVEGSPYAPCTPKGILTILDSIGYDLTGKDVVIIGRSEIVGKPLAKMLIDRDATVTLCHSKTGSDSLSAYLELADVVISAVGEEKLLTYFDFGFNTKVIIDVGINFDKDGKICGDVDIKGIKEHIEDAWVTSRWDDVQYTPVPLGVGLLTRLSLMQNTVEAWERCYAGGN